ncbi:ATP:cob(I)alamin adenosyltransferase [Candidatus Woesearchaeota archaeon]|nr:ATP:cob(I)alamin adenosyltransferase [Candidatus Woesearchaeota archaeon]|tara:strand:- start:488 stop:1021 length:534 start_codon:yes stop_codon:yes gene_type:complete
MRCYTRIGDKRKTHLFGCKLYKYSERVEAIGTIDELNAFLGAAASFSPHKISKKIIHEIENNLFSIGAELAIPKSVKIKAKHVERLEVLVEKIDEKLPQQTKFVIPAGTQAAMMLNVARTVARRAERAMVKLSSTSKVNPEMLKYMNRLSSLLYVLLRFENYKNNIVEKNPVYNQIR